MKTQDVIDLALASGLYQDDEMFFSPSTGEADVHISDLEYFAKLVKDRTLSKQKARHYQEGYEAGQHDMFTKSQNVDTSAERVHESDKSIHEEIERLKAEIKRLKELAEYRLKLLMKMPKQKEWVSLTDEEIAQTVGSPLDEVYLADFRRVIAKLKERNT